MPMTMASSTAITVTSPTFAGPGKRQADQPNCTQGSDRPEDPVLAAAGHHMACQPRADQPAGTASLATLVGEGSRYLWPDRYALRRIPVQDPAPVYPMSLIWRADNRHPALTKLRHYLSSRRQSTTGSEAWLPKWATPGLSGSLVDDRRPAL